MSNAGGSSLRHESQHWQGGTAVDAISSLPFSLHASSHCFAITMPLPRPIINTAPYRHLNGCDGGMSACSGGCRHDGSIACCTDGTAASSGILHSTVHASADTGTIAAMRACCMRGCNCDTHPGTSSSHLHHNGDHHAGSSCTAMLSPNATSAWDSDMMTTAAPLMHLWDTQALPLPLPQCNSQTAFHPHPNPHPHPHCCTAQSHNSTPAAARGHHQHHDGDNDAASLAACCRHVDSLLSSIRPHCVVMVVDATEQTRRKAQERN